jgi:hypothetical protein
MISPLPSSSTFLLPAILLLSATSQTASALPSFFPKHVSSSNTPHLAVVAKRATAYDGWTAKGCVSEGTGGRLLTGYRKQGVASLTVQGCLDICDSMAYAYAGLECEAFLVAFERTVVRRKGIEADRSFCRSFVQSETNASVRTRLRTEEEPLPRHLSARLLVLVTRRRSAEGKSVSLPSSFLFSPFSSCIPFHSLPSPCTHPAYIMVSLTEPASLPSTNRTMTLAPFPRLPPLSHPRSSHLRASPPPQPASPSPPRWLPNLPLPPPLLLSLLDLSGPGATSAVRFSLVPIPARLVRLFVMCFPDLCSLSDPLIIRRRTRQQPEAAYGLATEQRVPNVCLPFFHLSCATFFSPFSPFSLDQMLI